MIIVQMIVIHIIDDGSAYIAIYLIKKLSTPIIIQLSIIIIDEKIE